MLDSGNYALKMSFQLIRVLSDSMITRNTCVVIETLTWSLVKVEGAPPPCRLDHAMTTITLDLLLPPDSSTRDAITASPSPQALVTSTTSPPHIVTVIDPETAKDLTKSSGHNEVVKDGVEEIADESTLTGGVDPLFSAQSTQNGPSDTTTCVQTASAEEVIGKGNIDHQAQQEQSSLRGDIATVTALLIFGGMDTNGHIHSDCFIIVPPAN